MQTEFIANQQPEDDIYQIYDRIFKKVLTLSSTAVINFINGLYQTGYPLDSTIQYNWTENHDDRLHKTLADTIITINNQDAYHMEAQMTKDTNIVFRVFQYGFHHATRSGRMDPDYLVFPEPCIIYLSSQGDIPDFQTLTIQFGKQQEFEYRVRTFCYQDHDIKELNERKMILLIPFQLLKLKKLIDRDSSKTNIAALKKLISDDIIESININYVAGNITKQDAGYLLDLVRMLYRPLYGKNKACQEEGIIHMITKPLILETERLYYKIEQQEEELARLKEETNDIIAENDAKLEELAAENDAKLAEKDARLEALMAEIEALKAQLNSR